MNKSVIALAFSMMAASGSLFGSITTETFSHVTAQQSVPFDDPFTLPAFNTSLGTLISIELKLTNNSYATVEVANFDTVAAHNFTNATASVQLQVKGPDGTTNN